MAVVSISYGDATEWGRSIFGEILIIDVYEDRKALVGRHDPPKTQISNNHTPQTAADQKRRGTRRHLTTDRRETAEVYSGLLNYAAFVDKAVIEIRGARRNKFVNGLVTEPSRAIGGGDSFYARCIPGCSPISGNRLQVAYGLMRHFPHLAPSKTTFWAGRSPVLCSDALFVLDSYFRLGYRAKVSRVELTFDIEGIAYNDLTWGLCTRARSREEIEDGSGRTLYIGSPRGQWQAKIYERTYSVVRVEFIFRSTFLRALNIHRLQDVYLLRRAPVWDLVSFRETDQSRAGKLPPRLRHTWEELGHGVPPLDIPPHFNQKTLREYRLNPDPWIVPSRHQRLLKQMQKRLIW